MNESHGDPVRILLVEDNPSDAELLIREMRSQGLLFELRRVETREGLLEALSSFAPDIVLSDYALPRFSGLHAIQVTREVAPNTPVILVTGSLNEETAVECMKAGAADYVLKNHLGRIATAVRAALERKRERLATLEAEARYQTLFNSLPLGLFRADPEGRFLEVNPALVSMLGFPDRESLMSARLPDLCVRVEDRERWIDAVRRAGVVRGLEIPLIRPDGGDLWVRATIGGVTGPRGELLACEGTLEDITQQRRAEEKLRHQAYHDDLTGLPNRLLFADRFAQTLEHTRRSGRTLAMLLLDLDRFKTINDTLGHPAGDRLLRAIAKRLVGCVRGTDTVARFGGDEFMILLSGLEGVEDAARTAEKLLHIVSPAVPIDGQELHVTTSIGISIYPYDGGDIETLIKNADTALYRAKEQGRNGYQMYTPAMNASALEQLALENDLRRAIDRGELCLHYQPEVDLSSGEVVALEALVRWNRGGKLVPPSAFVTLAEDTGLILPMGAWVLEQACYWAVALQKRLGRSLRMAVNISARQLEAPEFARSVAHVLQGAGLDPQFLELELTESAIMRNPETAARTLGELRSHGVRSSIDDFGVGYSSLSWLKRLPVSALKIDQSFVRDVMTDSDDAAIVRAIVSLAHAMKLEVIAEGVETEDQLAFLRAEKCERMQGYLFSRPLAPEGLEDLLKKRERAPSTLTR